jgi:hypothetical protein
MPSGSVPFDEAHATQACLQVTPLSHPPEVGHVGVDKSTVTVPVGNGVWANRAEDKKTIVMIIALAQIAILLIVSPYRLSGVYRLRP